MVIPIFQIIIVMIVLGLVYCLCTLLPIPDPFKKLILIALIILAVVYLLSLILPMGGVRIGSLLSPPLLLLS